MRRSAIEIFDVRVHAYVLMSNHFHLIVETPKANLSEFMRQFNISYTADYNRRQGRTGHLYQGRFKAIVVDKDSYFTGVEPLCAFESDSDQNDGPEVGERPYSRDQPVSVEQPSWIC
jgi:hypothetical protein